MKCYLLCRDLLKNSFGMLYMKHVLSLNNSFQTMFNHISLIILVYLPSSITFKMSYLRSAIIIIILHVFHVFCLFFFDIERGFLMRFLFYKFLPWNMNFDIDVQKMFLLYSSFLFLARVYNSAIYSTAAWHRLRKFVFIN